MKKFYQDYLNKKPSFDKQTKYSILALLTVISGIFGFLYEYTFYFFNGGMKYFYWRGGNFSPWINIYAYGGLIVYYLTFKHRKNPYRVFFTGLLACGLLEFTSGYLMYNLFNGWRCWNYNTEIWNFGNIGGFICLRSITFFGLSSLILIYAIIPFCFYLAKKMSKKKFMIMSYTLLAIILVDDLYNLIFARLFSLPRAYDIYSKLGMHFVKSK